jgi:hypothetical protein
MGMMNDRDVYRKANARITGMSSAITHLEFAIRNEDDSERLQIQKGILPILQTLLRSMDRELAIERETPKKTNQKRYWRRD